MPGMARQKTETISGKDNYWLIDVIKFVFAILIVILHSKLYYVCPEELQYWIEKGLLRLAVPFFFLSSGFFLGKRINNKQATDIKPYIVKYSKRMLLILVVFEPVSLFLNAASESIRDIGWFRFILATGKTILFYPPGALWFVQACLIACWIIYCLLCNKVRAKIIALLGAVIYFCTLFFDSYFFLIEGSRLSGLVSTITTFCGSARNGITVGFPLLFLGMQCQKYLDRGSVASHRNIIVCVFSYVLFAFELLCLKGNRPLDDGSLFLFAPLFCASLLIFASKYNDNKHQFQILRNLSTGLYLLHKPLLKMFTMAFGFSDLDPKSIVTRFIITLCSALLLCFLSYRSRFTFIRNILK